MKVLLLGDFSGLHYTLKDGLEKLGHRVTLASDGDGWKNYPRDINLNWKGAFRSFKIIKHFTRNLRSYAGHDIVQLIHPLAFPLKAKRNLDLFKFLIRNNNSVFLGANGTDMTYLDYAIRGKLKYSVYNYPDISKQSDLKHKIEFNNDSDFRRLNEYIIRKASGISACCTEYKMAYDENNKHKTHFIPLPICIDKYPFINNYNNGDKIKFFLGIQEQRKHRKGMDILYRALLKLKDRYPTDIELKIAKNEPFKKYNALINSSNILCDQLYAYGLGMNGILGLSKGLIVAGGGKEEMYKLFNEEKLRPIIDLPNEYINTYNTLEKILDQKETLQQRAFDSRSFAIKHHCHIKVAKQYLDFWNTFN